MGKIFVVGIGPGDPDSMTAQALRALEQSDMIVGYRTYTDLVKKVFPGKEYFENGMRQEIERCRKCIELAKSGKTVALVCSGDAGVYGMASPLLKTSSAEGFDEIEIVPGVTAALSGAALLGAPIGHDFCVISLSDLLTPWERIEKRLKAAAKGDFCIVLYNPSSRKRADYLKRACEILMKEKSSQTACGTVKNIGREGTKSKVCTLGALAEEEVDMFTTVFVGNSMTKIVNGKLVTPRGYEEL